MNQFLFTLLFLCVICTSCRNSIETPDGGPCAYENTYYPATVIDIDTFDMGNYNLLIAFEYGDGRDTMLYYSANNNYVSEEEMIRYDIKPGSSCRYVHKRITEGHCNPDVFVFTLEP